MCVYVCGHIYVCMCVKLLSTDASNEDIVYKALIKFYQVLRANLEELFARVNVDHSQYPILSKETNSLQKNNILLPSNTVQY